MALQWAHGTWIFVGSMPWAGTCCCCSGCDEGGGGGVVVAAVLNWTFMSSGGSIWGTWQAGHANSVTPGATVKISLQPLHRTWTPPPPLPCGGTTGGWLIINYVLSSLSITYWCYLFSTYYIVFYMNIYIYIERERERERERGVVYLIWAGRGFEGFLFLWVVILLTLPLRLPHFCLLFSGSGFLTLVVASINYSSECWSRETYWSCV